MGDEAWSARRIGDFATRSKIVNTDGTQLPPLSITKDRGVVLQSEKYKKQIATDLRKYVIARRGQFAFDPMSLYYGAIGRVASMEIGLVSPDYVVFDVDDTIDKTFLNYLLRSPRQVAEYEAVAETGNSFGKRRRVYWSVLEQMALHVPPLGEQRKIATILSAVDEAIEATKAVIDQLQVVQKAMMAELLTRGMPERHTRFKQTEIGEIPDNWLVRPCGDLFDVQLGKMMSAQAKAGRAHGPYLRNENVRWLHIDLSDVATMHFDDTERIKFRLRAGDLLACEGRHIGRCAIWRAELDECYYQKALHRLRSKSSEITTEYMQFFMMLRFRFMTDLVAEANTTSTIPHLPRERLLALPVWYPPRNEQDEIVSILTTLLEREDSENACLAGLVTVKQALMGELLTGKLRVSPDEAVA